MKALLTQISLFPLRAVNKLPFSAQIAIGRTLGRILFRLASRRRHIAEVNLALCFPEKTPEEREALLRETFEQNGIGIIETSMAWWSDPEGFRTRTELIGSEHIEAALSQGKGVILLGAHYTSLDLGGLLFSLYYPVSATYRPHNNSELEKVLRKGRLRCIDELIDRSDFRRVIKKLKLNQIVWYAPDQDFGRDNSVFAPFFGVKAATVTATARLAKISQAPVILLAHHRTANNRYILRLHPALEPFPRANEFDSAVAVNQAIERGIMYDPAQYMWVHRRFKSQPDDSSLYHGKSESS